MASQGSWPGMHGRTMISTGLADLDSVLGGGLPLGSVLLLLQDAWTPHASTLLKYFAAEGVACQQKPTAPGRAEKEQQKAEDAAAEGTSSSSSPSLSSARLPSGGSAFRRSKPAASLTPSLERADADLMGHPKPARRMPESSSAEPLIQQLGDQTLPSSPSPMAPRLDQGSTASGRGASAALPELRAPDLGARPPATVPGVMSKAEAGAMATGGKGVPGARSGGHSPQLPGHLQQAAPSGTSPALKPKPKSLRAGEHCHHFDLTQSMPPDQTTAARVEYRAFSGPAALNDLAADIAAAIFHSHTPASQQQQQQQQQQPGAPAPPDPQPQHAATHEPLTGVMHTAGHAAEPGQKQQRAQEHHKHQQGLQSQQQAGPDSLPDIQAAHGIRSLAAGRGVGAPNQPFAQHPSAAVDAPLSSGSSDHAAMPRHSAAHAEAETLYEGLMHSGPPVPGSPLEDDAQQSKPQDQVECVLQDLKSLLQQRLEKSLPAQHAVSAISHFVPVDDQSSQDQIMRLVAESFGGPAWELASTAGTNSARSLVQCVMAVKQIVRQSKTAAMISFPAEVYSSSAAMRLQHLCDAVIALEAVAEDSSVVKLAPDPASCVALLHVRKLPGLNTFARPTPSVPLYLVRHKRRRLAIEAVEVDPDAEAALAAASGAPSGGPAAALACGGPAGAPKAFDF
ncbi:hypothetical protein WJX74_000929 [Apatococcus lobatus]|uniref:Elongator complex protein 4 n=1 Tax=Apatococcus lobatus TaxID=904363 RepID=A0AAW1QVP8_9CHLO